MKGSLIVDNTMFFGTHIFSLRMKIRDGTHLPWGAATLVSSKGLTIPG